MKEILGSATRPFFALGFLALAVACLTLTRDYAVPIAIAVLIWFLINASSAAIRRLPLIGPAMPGWLAKTVSVLACFALIGLATRIVSANIVDLGRGVTGGEEVVLAKLELLGRSLGFAVRLTAEEVYDRLEFDRLIGWALSLVQGMVRDVSLVFLYVMFLLVDERFNAAKLRALVPDDGKRARIVEALEVLSRETRLYLWLMSLISSGVGLITYAACLSVGLAGAAFWGFVAFLLNFIPTIGSIIAVVLPSVYALMTLENPALVAALIVTLSATQFVAGEVVLPRMMGNGLNLSSFVILLALVVWGAMWGPAGMFLAIPITVILTLVCARFQATRPIAIVLSRDGNVPTV